MKTDSEKSRISIIGLGLIGGSFGLALKAHGLHSIEIVGHDRDRGVANRAERMGAVDKAEHNLPQAVAGASLVLLATPIAAVGDVMGQIAPELSEGAVVTDTASTKAQVMRWAAERLPAGVHFVGGHPMAGKETQGIDNAEANLFRGKAYCLCPAVTADEAAVRAVVGLVSLAGAEPLFVDPEEHDQYAAAVSHLPLVLSAALFTLLRASPAWPDLAPMASSAFRDLTRLASGDPQMSHDICSTNREAVLHWLERMQDEVRRYRELLDQDPEELLKVFAGAQLDRDAFLAQPPSRRPAEQMPEVRQALVDSLVGGWAAARMRRARELPALLKETREAPSGEPGARRLSLAERIAEDIRRDLEKRSGEER